jgi:trehalose 6-phosphate phosphatase
MTRVPVADGSPESELDKLIAARLTGRPLILSFDVDGTLAPIVAHPSLAQVPEATRRIIASLVTRPGVIVILISGRAASDARRVVGVERVWAVGNHGAEVIDPAGDATVDATVSRYAGAVARTAQTLEPLVASIRGVLLEDKTWTLSIHYRGADGDVVPRLRGIVESVAAARGLIVTEGKKVLEIRPPVGVNKGTAISRLVGDLGGFTHGASVLFAGDDITDEDAFRFLREHHPTAVTICIGDRVDTAAEFTFRDTDQLRALLERIEHAAVER